MAIGGYSGSQIVTAKVGAGVATRLVAASNSINKSKADYVCDGVADQVEIQAAIDSLVTTGGGMVRLLDGTFNISSQIYIDENNDNIFLCGNGGSTVLQVTPGYASRIITIDGEVTDLVENVTLANFRIVGNYVTGEMGIAIAEAKNIRIFNIDIVTMDNGIWTATNCDGITITGNRINGCLRDGIFHTGDNNRVIITENIIYENDIGIESVADRGVIDSNILYDNITTQIDISGTRMIVTSNQATGGLNQIVDSGVATVLANNNTA